jgi:hypothetical protein
VKATEYSIETPEDRIKVLGVIKNLPEGKWTVKIWPWKQSKTVAQNRTLWMWYADIDKVRGWGEEAIHLYYKEKFLLNILQDDDPGFAMMADGIRKLREEKHEMYWSIRKHVVEVLVTTKGLKTNLMAKFMLKIKIDCFHEGIKIRIPPDKEMEWLCGVSKK